MVIHAYFSKFEKHGWRMIFSLMVIHAYFLKFEKYVDTRSGDIWLLFLIPWWKALYFKWLWQLFETILLFELIGIVIGGVSLVEIVNFCMNATTTVLWLVTVVELLNIHSILMVKYSNIHFFPLTHSRWTHCRFKICNPFQILVPVHKSRRNCYCWFTLVH